MYSHWRNPWSWGVEQVEEQRQLKKRLTTAFILDCPKFSAAFILQTDASEIDFGSVPNIWSFARSARNLKVVNYVSIVRWCRQTLFAVENTMLLVVHDAFFTRVELAPSGAHQKCSCRRRSESECWVNLGCCRGLCAKTRYSGSFKSFPESICNGFDQFKTGFSHTRQRTLPAELLWSSLRKSFGNLQRASKHIGRHYNLCISYGSTNYPIQMPYMCVRRVPRAASSQPWREKALRQSCEG